MRLASLFPGADKWQRREEVEAWPDPAQPVQRFAWEEMDKQPLELESIGWCQPVAVHTYFELGFVLGGSPQAQNGKEGVKQGRIPLTGLDSLRNCPFDNFLVWHEGDTAVYF